MHHAYGPADEIPALLLGMRSAEAAERDKALSRFYSAVHHQGDVYPCTTASLPFLFELAGDAAAPGRAEIVELLVSIGSVAVERCEEDLISPAGEPGGHAGAAAVLRERSEVFVTWVSDADPGVRRAAIPGVALFLDDADRAAAVLRGRLPAERGAGERLVVVEAMAALGLRLPRLLEEVMAWLASLAADPAAGAATRLAALAQRARCAPERIGEDAVPAAIGLLQEMAHAAAADGAAWDSALLTAQRAPVQGAPPQIAAAFDHLDRSGRVHALTTNSLRAFHDALGSRAPQRTALLAEQLRSPDPGVLTDALRMSAELMKAWRGDHSSLILLAAGQLSAASYEVAAEAAAVLGGCHPIARPARQALAAHVTAQLAAYGPGVWAAPQPQLRRAHQEAALALARLGDERAVPSVLAALDSGVDDWRAVQVAGILPKSATQQLVPRLCDYLRRADLAPLWAHMSAGPALSALAALGDQAALPVITEILAAAVRHEQPQVTRSALQALGAFGSAAAPALDEIRPLTGSSDAHVRPAAVTALWAVGGDREEVMALLHELLAGPISFWITAAADALGQIGPPASAALPSLRELLADGDAWVQVHCAAAVWEIGGAAEAPAVLGALLKAWARNPATASGVVACLDQMGPAAAPALPQLRSELAHHRRGGRFSSIRDDEELQRVSRAIIRRLA